MPSITVENYLKHVYLQQQHSRGLVPMGQLAATLGVTPGTATTMVKALAESGLLHYEPREGTRLTPNGRRLALGVLRRHRLVELFLVEVLGLDWSEVHEEAEELEHAVSEKVLEKIDALLGHPSVDPHGDPIPPAKGKFAPAALPLPTLAQCPLDQPTRVARVLDQDPPFLQFIERCGLTPGTGILVKAHDPNADTITVEPHGQPAVTIGHSVAQKILVQAT